MALKKKRKLIIGLSLAVVVIVVGAVLFSHSGSDYVSVGQFRSKADTYVGRQVSVSGKIAAGSINWDDRTRIMRFDLAEGSARVAVSYEGFIPERFKPGAEIVVSGRYGSDGVIQAASFGRTRSVCAICH